MSRLLFLVCLFFFCYGCADTSQPAADNSQIIQKELAKDCQASPPVQDSAVLRTMLMNNGTITADMTEEEKKQILKDFIKNKSRSNKGCK